MSRVLLSLSRSLINILLLCAILNSGILTQHNAGGQEVVSLRQPCRSKVVLSITINHI